MSGGSYLYTYRHIEEFADALESNVRLDGNDLSEPNCLKRLEFAAHLRLVAEAMKAIEWVDSFDCSPPYDTEAIDKVLSR